MLLPLASLSIHKLIGSVGNDIGFASIIAVAILVVLYFAHARETTALREQLEASQQHIAGLESRIAQLMQGQGMRRAPMPGGPPPGAAASSTVRRVPGPATAAASGEPASALAASAPVRNAADVSPARRNGAGPPSAPAGVGAPALASATRFRPATEAANGASRPVGARPRVAGPFPSRPAPRPADAPGGVASTIGGGAPPRRIGATPRPASSFPLLEEEPLGPRWLSGRLLPLAVGAVASLVIIIGLVVILTSGAGSAGTVAHSGAAGKPAASSRSAAAHTPRKRLAPFNPAHVTVAVMNGTSTAGLAADVGAKLASDGYRQGNITNASSQTEQFTYVYYLTGKDQAANLRAAQHVARVLALGSTRVLPASTAVLTSCAISAAGASLGSCSANVVVSLGQDRASLASSTTAG